MFTVSVFMLSVFMLSVWVRRCVLRGDGCKGGHPTAAQREPFSDFALKRPVWQATPLAATRGVGHKISPPGVSISPETIKRWWWIRLKMVRINGSKVIGVIPPDARSVAALLPKIVPRTAT